MQQWLDCLDGNQTLLLSQTSRSTPTGSSSNIPHSHVGSCVRMNDQEMLSVFVLMDRGGGSIAHASGGATRKKQNKTRLLHQDTLKGVSACTAWAMYCVSVCRWSANCGSCMFLALGVCMLLGIM